MKQKEIKNLAKKIVQQELILQNPNSSTEDKAKAELEIMKLSACVKSIADMVAVDDAVQDLIAKNS